MKVEFEKVKKPLAVATPLVLFGLLGAAAYNLRMQLPRYNSGLVISPDCYSDKNHISVAVNGIYIGEDLNRKDMEFWLYIGDLAQNEELAPVARYKPGPPIDGSQSFAFGWAPGPVHAIRGPKELQEHMIDLKPGHEIGVKVVRAPYTENELPKGEEIAAGVVKENCVAIVTKGMLPVPTPKPIPAKAEVVAQESVSTRSGSAPKFGPPFFTPTACPAGAINTTINTKEGPKVICGSKP